MKLNTKEYKTLFNQFKQKIKDFLEEDQEIIWQAFEMARKYHKGQIYIPNEPYIVHPLRVSLILLNLGIKDKNVICAALLHDTIEDTKLTLGEIEKQFGKKTTMLVKDLTRVKTSSNETEKERYQYKKKKYEKLMKKPKIVRIIKAADWLSHIEHWPQIPKNHPWAKKFPRWKKELHEFYPPLAKSANKQIYDKMKKSAKIFKEYIKN